MQTITCPECGAANRPAARYCMRCGKSIPQAEPAPTRRARAFVARELQAPFFGAYPEALDFSVASLPKLDTLLTELLGDAGRAPGKADWQPAGADMAAAPSPPPAPRADPDQLRRDAEHHAQRGHHGNAVSALRQLLKALPGDHAARIALVQQLMACGSYDDALREVDTQRLFCCL